ncbi:MAG: DNA translocase FtsK 4TM domain-containing protein [Elusimicrobia bacterium]|nr:DNA translocase FtsK 4TM domain-containing protein [Elusimicrobiota bacterium]
MLVQNRFAANKNKKRTLFHALYWVFSFSAAVWLIWEIFSPKGIAGETVSKILFSFLGQSAYLFPFIFLYGLLAILSRLNKPHKGILTLLAGILLILGSISINLELLRNAFTQVFFDGGWFGYELELILSKIFGKLGTVLSSIIFFFAGVQMLFSVSWKKIIKKTSSALIEDYKSWMAARKELKTRLKLMTDKQGTGDRGQGPWVRSLESQDTKHKSSAATAHRQATVAGELPFADMPHGNASATAQTPSGRQDTKAGSSSPPVLKSSVPRESRAASFYFKDFKLPMSNLLDVYSGEKIPGPGEEELSASRIKLEETFKNFGISAFVSGIYPGPVITRYEVTPSPGVKISSIVSLSNDVALAMKAQGIRVAPHIPGKSAIGFEIPNNISAKVFFREIIESVEFNESRAPLLFALGMHSEGSPATADLESMPHLLVAGATNSGKSVFLHSLILSLIYRNTPDEVKFVLIDPKRLELTFYEDIPYLYDPKVTSDRVSVITQAKDAAKSLAALTKLMEKRYVKFEKAKVKNIKSYNQWAQTNGEMPEFYIVVVIDELADLILQTKDLVEDAIQRLSQMARAVGIHLVLATQRPSVDIITGVIKANLPARVALQVITKTDSRVILDAMGAESLIGRGDMLYLASDAQKPARIQGAFVSEEEIKKVADYLRAQAKPAYPPAEEEEEEKSFTGKGGTAEEIISALRLISERKRVSQDLLKAHFGSSARATNLLSILEMNGFIHKPEGSNRWEIFFDKIEAHLEQAGAKTENRGERIEDSE